MTLTIRPYSPSDLPAVYALLVQLYESVHAQQELDMSRMQSIFQSMDAQPEFYLNLVGVEENGIVAFLSQIFYQTPTHAGGTALINELVVERAHRGAGLGQDMIRRARREAIARGMDEMEVGAEKDNLPALSFYHKCGFDEEYVLLGMEFNGEAA